MNTFRQLLAGGVLITLASACSVFDSGSSTSASSTSGSMIVNQSEQQVETLRAEIREQERLTEEAKLRAKSEEERLEAKKHQLKAAERELKADRLRTGG